MRYRKSPQKSPLEVAMLAVKEDCAAEIAMVVESQLERFVEGCMREARLDLQVVSASQDAHLAELRSSAKECANALDRLESRMRWVSAELLDVLRQQEVVIPQAIEDHLEAIRDLIEKELD